MIIHAQITPQVTAPSQKKPQKTKLAAVSPRNSTAVPPPGFQKTFIEKPATPPNGFLGAGYKQIKEFGIYWRQAKRAKVWQPLRKPSLIPLRLLAAGTFIALFWVLREILKFAMELINFTLVKLPYLEPLQLLYSDPTQLLLIVLFVLVAVSPWLLDWLLASYGQRELSKDVLNNHSRETVRVLHRYCQQRHWPLPKLRILPIAAPMILDLWQFTSYCPNCS